MSERASHLIIGGVDLEIWDTVARNGIGAPAVAGTVAAMTDTSKVYVYTGSESGYTAGNWYYYNGSAWVSGGVYNSLAIGDNSITDAMLIQNGGVLSRVSVLENALIDSNNIVLTNFTDDIGTSAMASTRRWFLPDIIPVNSYIGTVKYRTASAVSGTVVFEIWTKTGNTLTLAKSVESTPVSSSVNEVEINYQTTTECMFGWKSVDGTSLRANNGTYDFVMYAATDLSNNTLDMSDTSVFKTNDFDKTRPCTDISYVQYTEKRFLDLPSNVVLIGQGMDYEQIQDALLDITDDSASNPYTFLIMPSKVPYLPFSMVRNSFSDTYPWSGIEPRHISLVGVNKADCVIRSDSGSYSRPCGEVLTNGIIKNLSFVMTSEEQDPNATKSGYCLHIDCRTLDGVGYKLILEDCDFKNSNGPCVGIGVHKNCDLQFRRCRFETTLAADYNPHSGYTNLVDYGCLYCHTSTETDAPNQHFTLVDCVGTCAEGNNSLRIDKTTQYDQTRGEYVYTLINNVFWNKAQNAPSYSISGTLTADPMNFGNNNS